MKLDSMRLDPLRGVLCVDLETTSAASITNGGDAYSQHPSTRVWCACFGYSAHKDVPPTRFDWLPGQPFPANVRDFVVGGGTIAAFNVGFEKSIWKNILTFDDWPDTDPVQWLDVQALAAAVNLPSTLEGVGRAIGALVQKDLAGHKLMLEMAVRNELPGGGWTLPDASNGRLQRLVDYCWTDVSATVACFYRLPRLSLDEQRLWLADQKINARGVFLDQKFAGVCLRMANERKAELANETELVTWCQLKSSTGTPALKRWLLDNWIMLPWKKKARKKATTKHPAGPYVSESIDKNALLEVLERPDLPPEVRAVLENRREANKATSLAKFARVEHVVGVDGRLRHALRYCSAHTGRWASGGLQLHNLPKDKLGPETSALVRSAIMRESLDGLKLFVERPLEAISQTLRSVVASPKGFEIIGGDYSAIEARVVAWLAGQHDVVEMFANGVDVYTHAAQNVKSKDRQLGKVCTLGLGYGMGSVKLLSTAAGEPYYVRLEPLQSVDVVKLWRGANPAIVALWADLEEAAFAAIRTPGRTIQVGLFLAVYVKGPCLFLRLPSGRTLRYWHPAIVTTKKTYLTIDETGAIVENERTSFEIQFHTQAQDKTGMQVEHTYGGKLAENATQGVARDLLAAALVRFDALEDVKPYRVVLHVHDSIASEVPEGTGDVDEFAALMAETPKWAAGLPMKVDAYRDRRVRG